LVVDDNATKCLILGQQLTAWGMRPELEQDPSRALELVRMAAHAGDPFRVALVDLHMSDMGLELAEAIHADAAPAGLPVILLSSAGTVATAGTPQAGVALSLMKPVRQAELRDALVRAVTGAANPPFTAPNGHRSPSGPGGRRDVLVVEDNAINQAVAVGMLARLGYHADVAADGRQAVEAVARHHYTAVLMDCQMPEMDGYEATREIRRRESGDRHVPIIAMTASATESDRDRCLAAGMDDYVPKPVRPEKMEAALQRWVADPAGPP
jgi:CheY-like chemotaxis protein